MSLLFLFSRCCNIFFVWAIDFMWLASCSSALFCVVLFRFLLRVAQMFSANRAGLASQRKEKPDKHWLCRSRSPLDVSWQHTRFIFNRGTMEPRSPRMQTLGNIDTHKNIQRQKRKCSGAASMGFMLLSPSSIATNFLSSRMAPSPSC